MFVGLDALAFILLRITLHKLLKQFSLMTHEKTTWGEANKQFFHILNDMAVINLLKMTLTPSNSI